MPPVCCQCRPVLSPVLTSLCKESAKICPLCKFIAVLRLIDIIASYLVFFLSHRHHVDALAWFKTDFPVVLRHSRYHMIMGEMPFLSDIAVFYPDVTILFCKWNLCNRVLNKNRRVRFPVQVHYLSLVVYKILQPQRRGYHLLGCAEVIELTTSQRNNSYRQLRELTIRHRRVCAESTAKLRV